MKREPYWTESLAVGSAGFVEKIKPLILSRRETETEESDEGLWVLKEREIPYGQKTGSKNAAKVTFRRVFLHMLLQCREMSGRHWKIPGCSAE